MSSGVVLGPHSFPEDSAPKVFELAPHRSLSNRGAVIFVATVALATFSVAAFFTAQGFWPILPFAGLEIVVLAWAMRASMRSAQDREIITITADRITVEQRIGRSKRVAVFPRHWARVKLHAPPAAQHSSRLTLESHGRACEVGRFLTDDERCNLAVRLKQLVGKVNESPALG